MVGLSITSSVVGVVGGGRFSCKIWEENLPVVICSGNFSRRVIYF